MKAFSTFRHRFWLPSHRYHKHKQNFHHNRQHSASCCLHNIVSPGAKPDPSVGERRDDQDDLPREQGGDGLSLLDPYKKVVFEDYLINYLWWGEYS